MPDAYGLGALGAIMQDSVKSWNIAGAFEQGRQMHQAYEHDKMANDLLRMQIAAFPQQQQLKQQMDTVELLAKGAQAKKDLTDAAYKQWEMDNPKPDLKIESIGRMDSQGNPVLTPDGRQIYDQVWVGKDAKKYGRAGVEVKYTAGGAAGMPAEGDQGVDFAARTLVETGKMPQGIRLRANMQPLVLRRAAEIAKEQGTTPQGIDAQARIRATTQQGLGQVQRQYAMASSFVGTLDKNIENLNTEYQKLGGAGSPLVNRAIRAWQQNASGDPQVAGMVVFLNAVENEFAKIQSGSMGNQPISDQSRKEARETINKYMNKGQIAAVTAGMKIESRNRLTSMQQTISDYQDMLRGDAAGNTPKADPLGIR